MGIDQPKDMTGRDLRQLPAAAAKK